MQASESIVRNKLGFEILLLDMVNETPTRVVCLRAGWNEECMA